MSSIINSAGGIVDPHPGRWPALLSGAARILILPAVILIIWQVASYVLSAVVPSLQETWGAVLHGIERGWFVADLLSTLRLTLVAFAISAVAGLVIGVFLGLTPFLGRTFEPIIQMIYSIPKVVFYPLVMLVFGITAEARVAFGVLQAVLPVLLIVYAAMRSVPEMYLKVAAVYDLSNWQVFRSIVVPDVVPALARALRFGFSLAYLGVIIAEMFAAREGLGSRLLEAMAMVAFDRVFAITTVLALVALVGNGLFILAAAPLNRRFEHRRL